MHVLTSWQCHNIWDRCGCMFLTEFTLFFIKVICEVCLGYLCILYVWCQLFLCHSVNWVHLQKQNIAYERCKTQWVRHCYLAFADHYISCCSTKSLLWLRGNLLWIAGQVWAHHCCAAWSEGVIQTDDYSLHYVDKAVFAGLTQVCLLPQDSVFWLFCFH